LLAMDPRFWSQWQDTFRRHGLTPLMLSLLEDGGSAASWQAFADMLEDPAIALSFAEHLREEDA